MLCLILLSVVALAAGDEVGQYVVNGRVANPHDYPWQLSLQRLSSGTYYHICGAVLVNKDFAITAAHCVDTGFTYRVKCGAHNIAVDEGNRQAAAVSNIVIHPSYNPNGQRPAFPNDIAVLRLSTPVEKNEFCQAANLAQGSNNFGGSESMITGWGRLSGGGALPSRLKEGDMDVLTPTGCTSYWGSTVNSNIHICVKDVGDRIYGACNGDSGGPVQVGNTVVGLASFVASGCLTNYPSVYVRVSNYYNWIQDTMNSLS